MYTGISVGCEIAKGTFTSEFFVKISTQDGSIWEGAVDKEMVFDYEKEPTGEDYVAGRMYAYLINCDEEKALIELPVEDSTAGRRIIVPLGSIKEAQIPA
ncbi:MAG: hypothetical protein JRI96_05415 [Deltaproteobacteria bacterium]|nr:hypothetical protein [Deltaproteobacteria bacterium]